MKEIESKRNKKGVKDTSKIKCEYPASKYMQNKSNKVICFVLF
jgi:hypothetical protein